MMKMATKRKLPYSLKRLFGFLHIFLRNRRGTLGLAIISAFLFIAFFSPLLTPYDTLGRDATDVKSPLSATFGAPVWLRYLPSVLGGIPDLSENQFVNGTLDWNVSASHPSYTIYESSIGDPQTDGAGSLAVSFRREKGEIPHGEVRISITKEFEFPYNGFPGRFMGDIVLCANGTTHEEDELYYEEIPAKPDLNGDGVGNETDKKIIEDAMGSSDGIADLDGDGDVTKLDLGIWLYGTTLAKYRSDRHLDVPIEVHVFLGHVGGETWNIYPYYSPGRYYAPSGFKSDATGKVWIAKSTQDVPALKGWIYPQYGESLTSLINSELGVLRGDRGVFKGEDPVRTIFTETPGKYVWGIEIIFVDNESSDEIVETTLYIDNFNLEIHGTSFGLLGTDQYGRDLFAQLVYGSRISLYIGILTAVLGVTIGLVIGLAAGYLGRFVDEILMRFADTLLVLPMLPLLIVLIYVLGARIENLILIMGFLGWMGFSRLVRSQVLSLRERPFVEAAKAVGSGTTHIIRRHILPNVMSLVYVTLATTVPGAITVEASLAWLGFIDPTRMSWGRMLYENQYTAAIANWWWVIPPGLCIAALAVSFILLGFALDEILNPRLRRRR